MKLTIIDNINGDTDISTKSVYLYDEEDNQYLVTLNNGELMIQGSDGRLSIEPRVANELIIKTI